MRSSARARDKQPVAKGIIFEPTASPSDEVHTAQAVHDSQSDNVDSTLRTARTTSTHDDGGAPSDSDDLALSSDSDAPKSGAEWECEGNLRTEDLSEEAAAIAEDAELREYSRSLGIDLDADPDLAWVAREAFLAPVPPSWTEHVDETNGRLYFFNQVTQQSQWIHPMDEIFKELLSLIKSLRRERPPLSEAKKTQVIQAHIKNAHETALERLDAWSGPYDSETGQYFYNRTHEASTWANPVLEFEQELLLRQRVLHGCLLMESGRHTEANGGSSSSHDATPTEVNMPNLNLPELLMPELPGPQDDSARSWCTARSAGSLRSPNSPSRSLPTTPQPKKGGSKRTQGVEQKREEASVAPIDDAIAFKLDSPSRSEVSFNGTPHGQLQEDCLGAAEDKKSEIYSQFSKLYHFVGNKWEAIGTGEAKLQRIGTGQVRFMLRQEKTMKVLGNHLVVNVHPYCDLLPQADGDTCWVWTAQDFADGKMKVETLALKLGTSEKASSFKEAFEKAKQLNRDAAASAVTGRLPELAIGTQLSTDSSAGYRREKALPAAVVCEKLQIGEEAKAACGQDEDPENMLELSHGTSTTCGQESDHAYTPRM